MNLINKSLSISNDHSNSKSNSSSSTSIINEEINQSIITKKQDKVLTSNVKSMIKTTTMNNQLKSNKSFKAMDDLVKNDNFLEVIKSKLTVYIVILGDVKSGKSSLINSYIDNSYKRHDEYKEHMIRFTSIELNASNVLFDVVFIEFPGEVDYAKSFLKEYLILANCFVIVHSLETRFHEARIEKWYRLVKEFSLPVYLVGSKLDLFLLKKVGGDGKGNLYEKDNEEEKENQLEDYKVNDFPIESDEEDGNKLRKFNKIQEKPRKDMEIEKENKTFQQNPEKKLILKEENKQNTNINTNTKDLTMNDVTYISKQVNDFIIRNKIKKYFMTSSFMSINVNETVNYMIKTYLNSFILEAKLKKFNFEDRFGCNVY